MQVRLEATIHVVVKPRSDRPGMTLWIARQT